MFKVNFLVYLFALAAILTASFKIFFIISFLIIIHELGHFLVAKTLGVQTDKIYIYPLGGIAKFNMPLNISPIKEFLILIAGPLNQVIASIILSLLLPRDKNLIEVYNYGILIFNLLPIYPLDGGKLVNLFLETFIPYKLSLKLSIYISYLFIIIILLSTKSFTINIIIMLILSLFLITKENKRINFTHKKFILERYLNNYNFHKSRIVKGEDYFYRNKRHLIVNNTNYYPEKEYLAKKYQKS